MWQPAWEVDVFEVPPAVAELFFEDSLYNDLATRLGDTVKSGLQSLLVTSVDRGEGRSTVAIGMALAAATTGIRVALVDLDLDRPALAEQLRLDLDHGWVDHVRQGTPLGEIAVRAVEDQVTLLPLLAHDGQRPADAAEAIQLIERLESQFDLIVLDGMASDSPTLDRLVASVDSAIVVRDMTRTETDRINAFSYRLKEAGVRGVGVVENYC